MGTVYSDKDDYVTAAREYRTAVNSGYASDQLSWALGYQQPPDAWGGKRLREKPFVWQTSLYPAYYHLGRALLLQKRYDEGLQANAADQSRSAQAAQTWVSARCA